ncbi:MAG: T9SS type A sorting domain-containing protein [Sphingobacteriales bacterium]|nr:MAG: T9SS type A sorting domain-containing protein [Sphingobacteriales bacterium]
MRSFVLVGILLLFIFSAKAQEQHHRIKVFTGIDGLQLMSEKGIAMDHGIVKKGYYFISDFSDSELAALRTLDLPYEIQIENIAEFYAARNKDKTAERPVDEKGCLNCMDYATPVNFTTGSMGGFYTYNELLGILDSMRVKYPGLISMKQAVGNTNSIEGRSIYYVRISNNPDVDQNDKPEVLYTALHHAREAQSLSQLVFYMWYLLEQYGADTDVTHLLNNRELYFVPCVNPDGYIYNQATNPGGGGMWRKNRRDNGNSYGVDLNRNYNSYWGYDNTGSSPQGNSETYRGTAAFSENETQAIRDFCNSRKFVLALNAHTFSNLLIYPYSHIPDLLTPDSATFSYLAHEMSLCSGFNTGTPNQTVGYSTNGDSDGWMYDEQASKAKIFALTPEAGSLSDGFWPMPSRIIPIAKNTLQQNLYAAWLAGAFAELKSGVELSIPATTARIPFEFKRIGITNGDYTVSLIAVSNNIVSVGNPVVIADPLIGAVIKDTIDVQLNSNIIQGEAVQFALKWDHPSGATHTDTFTVLYGNPAIAFYTEGNAMNGFDPTGSWGINTTDFTSATGSIAESPSGNYAANTNSSITSSNWIDLQDADKALMVFDARWEIEKGFDYTALEVQEEGGAWIKVCGNFTAKGSENQGNFQVYDGESSGWVRERVVLDQFAGKRIKFHFVFVSDGFGEGAGFQFDELKILKAGAQVSGITSPAALDFGLSNVPNPATNSTEFLYRLKPGYRAAKLVIRDAAGRIVMNRPVDPVQSSVKVKLDYISPGIYYYRIETDKGISQSKKMVIIR